MQSIIVIGLGGHAKSVIDSIESNSDYKIVGYTDNDDKGEYKGYKWLGTDNSLEGMYKNGVENAVICLGYLGSSNVRDDLYNFVKEIGYNLPVIADASAIIASDVSVDEGTFIGKGVVINSNTRIGKMCIINTGAIIEHDNNICDFSHVAVGVTLCGGVSVGTHCFIGANSTIIQYKTIGDRCIVGAGSIVLNDVDDDEKCYGIVKG